MVNKKSDGGSQVKESTDSNATLEEEDVRGNLKSLSLMYSNCSKQFCFLSLYSHEDFVCLQFCFYLTRNFISFTFNLILYVIIHDVCLINSISLINYYSRDKDFS